MKTWTRHRGPMPTNQRQSRMLTPEQVQAIGAHGAGVFIEAHPGSGKTTVASERFGALRFSPTSASDSRAVIATSFTKAATRELRARIMRAWGPAALRWPHRVVTVDTLVRELLVWLLAREHVSWTDGARTLTVHDSWRGAARTTSTRTQPVVELRGRHVVITHRLAANHASRVGDVPVVMRPTQRGPRWAGGSGAVPGAWADPGFGELRVRLRRGG
jgi:DNA helicase-2/ATP-dependent DNA helicase PcrA